MRINKYLSSCGVASRRKCDDLIKSGVVKVNGKVLTELGYDVKEDIDQVTVRSKPMKATEQFVYYKLNKPKGYVCTTDDEKNRRTVMDLMRGVKTRIFPVGRLDYDTEGLLILTNDGDISNKIMKPSSEIGKTYVVKIDENISKEEIDILTKGVDIDGYITRDCNVDVFESNSEGTRLEITIFEGKNRQIRKMFEKIEKNITYLKRISIGKIKLGGLSRGEYTTLNKKELDYLRSL